APAEPLRATSLRSRPRTRPSHRLGQPTNSRCWRPRPSAVGMTSPSCATTPMEPWTAPASGLEAKLKRTLRQAAIKRSPWASKTGGKIIAAGTASNGATGNDFALSRYSTLGVLDTTFGSSGKVLTDFAGGNDQAFAMAIQTSDGKIVAAGGAFNGINGSDYALARYSADGAIDT